MRNSRQLRRSPRRRSDARARPVGVPRVSPSTAPFRPMSSSVRRLFADRDIPPRRRRHHPLRVRVRLTLLRLRFSTTARITSPGSCTTTSTPGAPPPPHSRRRSLSFIAPCPQSTWCVRSPRSTCPHASFSEAVEWTPLFEAPARRPLDSTRSRPRFRPPNPLHPDRTHSDARTSFPSEWQRRLRRIVRLRSRRAARRRAPQAALLSG